MFQLQLRVMKEKPRTDVLTLSTTFYDHSVSCNILSKAEMRHFGASEIEELNSIEISIILAYLFRNSVKFLKGESYVQIAAED